MRYTVCALLMFTVNYLFAQQQDEEIRKVISGLFSAMQQGDSAKVRSLFLPEARLQTALNNSKDNTPKLIAEPLDSFYVQVASMKVRQLKIEERITSWEIKTDEPLACAWVTYEFYVNDKLSHTGVDAFQLFKTAEGWKIFQLCDTRKKVKP